MRRTENLKQRAQELLARVQLAKAKRDEHVNSAKDLMHNEEQTEQWIDFVNDVARTQSVKLVDQAVTISSQVQESAKAAEHAIRQVKRLDRLSSQVDSALEIVTGMSQQQSSVDGISKALNDADYAQATKLIVAYEAATKTCVNVHHVDPMKGSSTNGENGGDAAVVSSPTTLAEMEGSSAKVMASAKQELLGHLRAEISTVKTRNAEDEELRPKSVGSSGAAESNHQAARGAAKTKLFDLCKLLSSLGEGVEAYTTYCGWISDRATADIKSMVEEQLSAMGHGGERHGHLNLVSQVLDHVVATLENEEEQVSEAFGAAGMQALLLQVHHECTRSSVEVLQNFLSKRVKSSGSGGAKSKSSQEPRILDQTLEEISHLVSCCHLYMGFMEDKFKNSGTKAAAGGGSAADTTGGSQYSLEMTKGNALFDMVQELLAIYIPLQNDFFETAFSAAVELEKENAPPMIGSSSDAGAGGGFMGGLTFLNKYRSNNEEDGLDSNKPQLSSLQPQQQLPPSIEHEVTLVDDVFYFLRVALHRAVGTKSIPIVSAVIIAINNVLRDQLVPFLDESYHALKRDGSPLDTIRWVNAIQQSIIYTKKFSEELVALTDQHFTGDDKIRFHEQQHDITHTATQTEKKLNKLYHLLANSVVTAMYEATSVLENFTKANYIVSQDGGSGGNGDEAFPWLSTAIQSWGPMLEEVKTYMNEVVSTEILNRVVTMVVQGVQTTALGKQYDAYGALQLDKDVRTLRSFFSECTDAPVRDRFASLITLASILTSSSLSEAEDVASSFIPSAPVVGADGQQQQQQGGFDIPKVMKLRVDFR